MAYDNVLMWNCAGFRDSTPTTPSKFLFLDKQFPNANFSIAALVETHHKDQNDFSQDLGQYQTTHNIFHSPVKDETHSGVILVVRKDFELVSQSEPIPGRLLNVRMTRLGRSFSLSVFYGHQWVKFKKEEISKILQNFEGLHNDGDRNIILGDFNFVDHDIDKGKGMTQKDKMIHPIWHDFLSRKCIADPFREQRPKMKTFSFVASQGKSRGDRLYINDDRIASVRNFRYVKTVFQGAHRLLRFELQKDQDLGPGIWKMNSSVLNDPKYVEEIENVFRDLNQLALDPRDWWDLFIMVVQGVSVSYCKMKAKIKNSLKNFYVAKVDALEKLDLDALTPTQKADYVYYKNKLRTIIEDEIRGHEIRTRGQPKYEINEPNISMYSGFEKRYQAKNVIYQLVDEKGNNFSENENLLDISEKYYTKLFSKSRTCPQKQDLLLRKISNRLGHNDRVSLDAPLNLEELDVAVSSLANGKSPGPDGITVEFYKKFWHLIRDRYLTYINASKEAGFHGYRNTSSTTIIYKNKGVVYHLDNYRPIALINVDLKILTKALSNRLRPVLETIIHHSQTAVDRRRIDHAVHLLRDLIDLANKEDTDGALIFLDQEKAFDRVEHDFLFKTMSAFGIGDSFIDWLKVIYANAATKVKVNGFFTNPIFLRRGLRQGCPLSPSLYVLVIEIFALCLRSNPNIVGFVVGGERIVSAHYADDATIVITQNRCFKEVIKEISDYELASGAKVNYGKTKGLWLGGWKQRTDSPLGITWTSGNVKTLGLHFGNDNPTLHTFNEIIPKVKKSMNYWKQFKLSKFSKSRVIEIFHASRLWYACTFYPLPQCLKKDLQLAFLDFVNFPRTKTVSEVEMKKLRLDGGIKLIDLQTKIDTYRVMWLFDLTVNSNLLAHKALFTSLVGTQKGGLQGTDLIFVNRYYCKRLLRLPQSPFYQEAFFAASKLTLSKQITDLRTEKIFYNNCFRNGNLKTIPVPARCERDGIFTYGEIAEEYTKQSLGLQHKAYAANVFPKIVHANIIGKGSNTVFISEQQAVISFTAATCKDIYGELIKDCYVDHHSVEKWEERFGTWIDWDKVWTSVCNPVSTENTRSVIWEQIHLNDYCTYAYNKWHNAQDVCPLCLAVPSKFHLTLECKVTNMLWNELEPHLRRIVRVYVSDSEKVFGVEESPGSILRNWLTFILRECIVRQESIAYHNKKGLANIYDIKIAFNNRVKTELFEKYRIYENLGRLNYFEKIFAVNDYLITWENEWWQVLTIFSL